MLAEFSIHDVRVIFTWPLYSSADHIQHNNSPGSWRGGDPKFESRLQSLDRCLIFEIVVCNKVEGSEANSGLRCCHDFIPNKLKNKKLLNFFVGTKLSIIIEIMVEVGNLPLLLSCRFSYITFRTLSAFSRFFFFNIWKKFVLKWVKLEDSMRALKSIYWYLKINNSVNW